MSSKSDIAVSVGGLSKCYAIAQNKERHTTAAEALMHRLRNPFAKALTDTFWALKDVSFDIHKGDVVGIIGRNGAGKSTLLKILSRITEPTAGRIKLYGRVGSLLEVGTGFHPELTGRENIYLNGAILGMTRQEITRQFDAIVDFSGTEPFLDTPVKRYSSGMYVRLAFAVAAHLNPEILIVDEVLAVGDAEFQKKCLGKMKDVANAGRTVLFVSHNIDAVRRLCTRGLLLHQGRLVMSDSARAVSDEYVRHSVQSAAEFDVTVAPEKGSAAFAYKVAIRDGQGALTPVVLAGQTWQVSVDIRVHERIEGIVVSLGVNTIDGFPVYTTWTPPTTLESGCYRISFREEKIYLEPGYYHLLASLSIGGRVFHAIDEAGQLEIGEIANFQEVFHREKLSGCGVILNPLRTEIVRID